MGIPADAIGIFPQILGNITFFCIDCFDFDIEGLSRNDFRAGGLLENIQTDGNLLYLFLVNESGIDGTVVAQSR
jgi:hypothetical protein